VKRRTLAIIVVVSLLALLTMGCAVTDLLKKKAGEKVEEVVAKVEEVEPEEGEATAASPTKPSTKAEKPTPTAEAEEAPLSLGSVEELDSYRQTMRISGRTGDEEYDMEIIAEFVREPRASRFVMKGRDETGQDSSMEMIQIGDTTYMQGPNGDWMSMTSSESEDMMDPGILDAESGIDTDSCKYKGKDKVGGLQAKHYFCDKAALFSMPGVIGAIESGQADIWVSTKYDVPVKMVVDGKGKDEDGVEFESHWELEITAINKPIKIEAPEGVEKTGLPEDIPLIDGAYEVNAIMGIVSFKVDMAVAEVSEFYKGAMPRNGWTAEEGAAIPNMLAFGKGDRTVTFMLGEEDSTTSVTIMVNEDESGGKD